MPYTDDPVSDFNKWDDEQQKRLERLPVCCHCDEPIQQEHAVHIDDCWYCDKCIDGMREYIEVW